MSVGSLIFITKAKSNLEPNSVHMRYLETVIIFKK